jgi:hypothetical protein
LWAVDYARTLREWERRFIRNFDQIIAPCLLTTYPELDRNPHRVEIFKRKWICQSLSLSLSRLYLSSRLFSSLDHCKRVLLPSSSSSFLIIFFSSSSAFAAG